MEKNFKFSDKPLASKILYGSVVAILCITAIVIGIISAAQRTDNIPEDNLIEEETPNTDGEGGTGEKEEEKKELTFVAPLVGTVVGEHDMAQPVFSNTLGAWRVHTGIDISAEAGAKVYASEEGTVTGIFSDPMLGYTVEITHRGGIVTRYSNLADGAASEIKVGDKVASGDIIGVIGDSAISELAEEPHLHFEVLVNGEKKNPLSYISEESKKASLGIKD